MFIDVHAHLTFEYLLSRLDEVLSAARATGVEKIVTCGLGHEDALRVLELRGEQVLVSLGVAPYDLRGFKEVLELIYKRPHEVDVVGEVGLDLYMADPSTLESQKEVFYEFIEAARIFDKPLITHSRHAGKQVLEIVMRSGLPRVDMHAYDGPISLAKEASERGIRFSIPPRIATSEQKKQLVRKLSLDALILETDSPFLGPSKGRINEPSNVIYTIEWISRLKSIAVEKVIEKLYDNSLEFLGLV